MKRAWSDGTTSIVFDAVDLIDKLVALIPPRHFNLTSYAGVFASRSALRDEVVLTPPGDEAFRKVCEHPSSSSRWVGLEMAIPVVPSSMRVAAWGSISRETLPAVEASMAPSSAKLMRRLTGQPGRLWAGRIIEGRLVRIAGGASKSIA